MILKWKIHRRHVDGRLLGYRRILYFLGIPIYSYEEGEPE